MRRIFNQLRARRVSVAGVVTSLLMVLMMLPVGGGAAGASAPVSQEGPTSPNGLVINEIFYSQTVGDQYFELYNTSASSINLSTYQIYNRDGSNNLSNLADPIIAPGQFRVIGPTQLGTPTIAGSGLARTDFLALVNTSPVDAVIDVVNFGASPNPNWPNYERFSQYFFSANVPQLPVESTTNTKSLQRWPDGVDTDQGTDFAQIFSSPGAPSCADPFEDDNTSGNAATQNVGSTTLRRLCPAGDQDWIAISMSTSLTYTLSTTAQGSQVDTVLRLYDASGNLLAEDNNSTSRNSTISFRPSTAGTFRVQVTDANNAGNSGPNFLYTFSATSTTANTPTATTPTPIGGCTDAYEPDNSLTTAKGIELNSEQTHLLCPANDSDWLVFSASPGKIYTMYTEDLAGPVDTLLTLYDGRGNVLAENDDYQPGQGLESRIDYSFTSPNLYYLRVRDRRGAGAVGYQYTVGLSSEGALPSTGTPTRTPTINPNATATSGPCYDAFEPDGVPETARVILIGDTQRHSICPAVDADWVRFYARAGKVYTVRTGNLGVGLDTYMYIFDSDGSRILAQNDDGGESVASRIDFYPLRDDWYFVQVKNAGDIGGSNQIYDLSLIVLPGAPQPPSTATPGGPPAPAQGTPTAVRTPTTVVQPTAPRLSTPTQGNVPPTPTAVRTATLPPAVPTTVVNVPPTAVVPPAVPTSQAVEPTAFIPGVPVTGAKSAEDPKPKAPAPAKPQPAAPAAPASAPMLLRVFYDHNRSDSFDLGEGIRGLEVLFLSNDVGLGVTGSLRTEDGGTGRLTLPVVEQRVYIPYLGINVALNRFPERELHSLWLPPVQLPQQVP